MGRVKKLLHFEVHETGGLIPPLDPARIPVAGKPCAGADALEEGTQLHLQIKDYGLRTMGVSLVNM